MQGFYVIILIYLLNIQLGTSKKLPSNIQKCKYTITGSKLSDCIIKNFYKQKDYFLHGISELQLPALDPMIIDRIDFNTGNGTAITVNAVFSNITLYGCNEVNIQKLRIDIEKGVAEIKTSFPQMRILADYNMKGKFLVLQLNGAGKADGNFSKIHSTNHLKGRFMTKRNKTFIEWYESHVDLSIVDASMYFYDLFKDNPELTASTNKVINENAIAIINDLKPIVQQTISTVTFSIMSRIFKLFSVDELFDFGN